MTRSERVRAACERFAEGRPDEMAETVNQGIEAALDAALADVGGLDGLGRMIGRATPEKPYVCPVCGRAFRGPNGIHTTLGISRSEGRCPGTPVRVPRESEAGS